MVSQVIEKAHCCLERQVRQQVLDDRLVTHFQCLYRGQCNLNKTVVNNKALVLG